MRCPVAHSPCCGPARRYRALAMPSTGLPWPAWWVLEKTGSAAVMASVLIFSFMPTLLFLLVGAVAVDRWPRLRVMWISDVLRRMVVLIVALIAARGTLEVGIVYFCQRGLRRCRRVLSTQNSWKGATDPQTGTDERYGASSRMLSWILPRPASTAITRTVTMSPTATTSRGLRT